jgi:hypothetical protein
MRDSELETQRAIESRDLAMTNALYIVIDAPKILPMSGVAGRVILSDTPSL